LKSRVPKALQWAALNLTERLNVVRAYALRAPEDGAKRIETFKSIFAGGADETFDRWLEIEGCSHDELAAALTTPGDLLLSRIETAPWQQLAAELLSLRALERVNTDVPLKGAYLDIVQPFVQWGTSRGRELVDAVTGSDAVIDRASVLESARAILASRLLDRAGRAITLELHIQKLLGNLEGETRPERLRCFTSLVRHTPRAWQRFFLTYPVLTRLLAKYTLHWKRNLEEALRGFFNVREQIVSEIFRGADPGRLVSLAASLGDLHAGGREVLLFKFESGKKLLYKPRDLSVDLLFRDAAARLHAQGFEPAIDAVAVVADGAHGWAEFIDHHPASSEAGIRDFYRRQGAYLALIWLLSGTDLHSENVIASGDQPKMIDLEALFHRHLPSTERMLSVGQRALYRSVQRTGLLPGWTPAVGDNPGVDISGLGGRGGQMYPHEVDVWETGEDDDPSIVRRRIQIPVRANRPLLRDEPVDVLPYEDDVVRGFEDAAALFVQHRHEWRQISESFAHCEVREVIRPTYMYARLVQASQHPDYLRDAVVQDSVFARMCNAVNEAPEMRSVVVSEIADLRQGDVPRFSTEPGGRALLHKPDAPIESFYDRSALDDSFQLLRSINETEIARQVRIIRGALAILPRDDRKPPRVQPPVQYDERAMIAEARRIGDELLALAIREGNEIEWLGLQTAQEQLHFVSTGYDLYYGSAGVGVFLTYLYRRTNDERYRDCMRTIANDLAGKLAELPATGAYFGLGSVVYFLHHYAAFSGERALLDVCIDRIAAVVEKSIADDAMLDIVAGSAGLLLIALNLYEATGDVRALDAAVTMGEFLVRKQTPNDRGGAAWQTAVVADAPLTGFAHGAAGIAYALDRLACATGRDDFKTAAQAAIEYERSVYMPEVGNWPDFRTPAMPAPDEMRRGFSWCHGGPGIALGRLKSLRNGQNVVSPEIETVLQQLQGRPLIVNDCLCHGELGNVETLIVASQKLGREDLLEAALATRHNGGELLPRGELAPGLLTGIAGVGLGFLRVADPDGVPSVLSLDGPPSR
jgi:type 2 lantibiotic biosynthesis protein LanM